MKLNDFERQVLAAAQAEHADATLGELAHTLDSEARAAEDALSAGEALAVAEACKQLILASALLIARAGLSWTMALLDPISKPETAQAKPKKRRKAS